MRNARLRMMTIGVLLCGLLMLAPNSWAQQRAPLLDQIAKTYGIDSWDQVEGIRYTWNGEITGLFKAAHRREAGQGFLRAHRSQHPKRCCENPG